MRVNTKLALANVFHSCDKGTSQGDTAMTTLSKLKKEAAKIGATVEQDRIGDTLNTEVFSPSGFRFASDSTHIFVDCVYVPWKPDYADLLNRISYGLEPCEDAQCEWCHP
jgi:hypothetical protein